MATFHDGNQLPKPRATEPLPTGSLIITTTSLEVPKKGKADLIMEPLSGFGPGSLDNFAQ